MNERGITVGSLVRWRLKDMGGPCVYLGKTPKKLIPKEDRPTVGRHAVWAPVGGFLLGVDIDEHYGSAGGYLWELVWLAPEDLLR